MWSQIIFFAAVALLVILLLRRAAVARADISSEIKQTTKMNIPSITSWTTGATNAVIGLFSAIGSRINSPRKKTTVETPEKKMDSVNAQGHNFWKEEAIHEKYELSSHFEEGEQLYKAGKFDEAEQFFVKSAANNPSDPKVYARLGLLYLQTKNYSDAIEALKVAVKLDKYNPSRHYNLALAYYGNKDGQKAISAVREAITLDPVTQKYRALLEQLLNG